MFRRLFTTQRKVQNSRPWTSGLPILSLLAFLIFLATDTAPAVTVSGHGTDLPQVWGEVVARDLEYINPQGPWPSVSVHEYEIINYSDFEVKFDYEFRHWVVEVNDKGEDGKTVVDVPPRGRSSVKLSGLGSDFNGGVLTGDCGHLEVGRKYRVKAYTRIHAWKAGQTWIADNWKVNAEYEFRAKE